MLMGNRMLLSAYFDIGHEFAVDWEHSIKMSARLTCRIFRPCLDGVDNERRRKRR